MVWNFGMGRPTFSQPRQESQTVSSFRESDVSDWMSGWQSRYDAEAGRASAGSVASKEYLPSFAWSEGLNMRGGPWAPVSDMGRPQFINGWQSEDFGGTRFGHDDGGVYMQQGYDSPGYTPDFSALNAEKAAKEAEFAAARERQNRQQQAYSQQLGSNFAGGIINDSYQTPFGGQITGQSSPFGNDPGMPGVTMPWAQPWGTPGYGGATGGQSIGGYSPQGIGAQNNQQSGGFGSGSGWGGPFGKSNPWSLD
jgi:hypothetical protein